MKFKLSPIQQCLAFLILMALIAVGWYSNTLTSVEWSAWAGRMGAHAAMTVGWSLLLFGLFTKLTGRKKSLEDAVITSLILFLLLHFPNQEVTLSQETLAHGLVATSVAMGIKWWGLFKGMPVINPVVGGLLLTLLIFHLLGGNAPFISWWGTDFGGLLSLVLVFGWIVLGLKKWRKYPLLLSFLLSHALLLLFQGKMDFLTYSFTHSTLYFMVGIMLIEPKTSPSMKQDQIAYGVLAGVVYNTFLTLAIPYAELWTIAFANGLYLVLKMKRMGIGSRKV